MRPQRQFSIHHCLLTACVASMTCGTLLTTVQTAQSDEPGGIVDTDVLVVGASEGGVMAAIQAARLGRRVMLLEDTDWIGGQATAAAVTSMDGNIGGIVRDPTAPGGTRHRFETGLYGEFMRRVRQFYARAGKSIGTCYYEDWSYCFEPAVGQAIMCEMLGLRMVQHEDQYAICSVPDDGGSTAQPPVDLRLRTYPVAVLTDGNRVTGVVTNDGTTILADQTIDATEYGDVLALSPAAYRAGNSTSEALNPNACVQDITYTAVTKRYTPSVPTDLLLHTAPPGYAAMRDIFASGLRPDPEGNSWDDWIAYKAEYDRLHPEAPLGGMPRLDPVNWDIFKTYRGMPHLQNPEFYTAEYPLHQKISRTDINDLLNDTPYLVGHLDRLSRKEANCRAKLRTLQLLYYMQSEIGPPVWAIANDQGYATPYNAESDENDCATLPKDSPGYIPPEFANVTIHFPVKPYIRESRRLVGLQTLTAPEELTHMYRPHAVAIHDMGFDLHACKTADDLEEDLGEPVFAEETEGEFGTTTFQTPMEIYIPESVDGLVMGTGKLLSVSRIVNGATRNQPSSMLTGQASGVIAALSSHLDVQPRNLDVRLVQDVLLDADDMLMHYLDVLDNHPYFKGINVAALKGIMLGYAPLPGAKGRRRFAPESGLTRAQMAIQLAKMFHLHPQRDGSPFVPPPTAPSFVDVPPTKGYYLHAEAIYAAGITGGCKQSGGRLFYCPESPTRRGQMAVFVVNGAGYELIDPPVPSFTDVSRTHPFYKHIETATAHGLFAPGGRFRTDDSILRGEAADVTYRYLRDVGEWPTAPLVLGE